MQMNVQTDPFLTMLDDYDPVDKHGFVGGCSRLEMTVDADRLVAEFESIPDEAWGSRAGRVNLHQKANAIFLRGYARAEGFKPVEDRSILATLPYMRELIHETIGTKPLRCLLARLSPGDWIRQHVDFGPYFEKSWRIHVPVVTNDSVDMYCNDHCYHMKVGEVWSINNFARHAVKNGDPDGYRTHIICDFLPEPDITEKIAAADRSLGTFLPDGIPPNPPA
jgi:hypothetical protein